MDRHQDAIHEERNRIARELHNQLGRALTTLKFEVASVARSVSSRQKRLGRQVASLEHKVSESIQIVQQVCRGLYQFNRSNIDLRTAVDREIAWFQKYSRIQCHLTWTLNPRGVSEKISCVLLEILAESLTNVARHSFADRVHVRFVGLKDAVLMEVEDNGQGCAKDRLSSADSLGLIIMRDTCLRASGTFHARSGPNTGTLIRVRLPDTNS